MMEHGLDPAIVGPDRWTVYIRFLDTLGRNDDAAVIATEELFFAFRYSPGQKLLVTMLLSDLLAPRPTAILLARIWHSGKLEVLDIANPARIIVPLFRAVRDRAGDVLMDRNGLPIFRALPERVTVYRGATERQVHNPSWTLDLDFAREFAARLGDDARVFAAEIERRDALAVFSVVGEREVVVDPAGLRNVRWLGGHA